MYIEIKHDLRRDKIRKVINNRISQQITIFFNRVSRRITRIVQIETRRALEESVEVQSMIYGILRGELGLTEPKGKLKRIIDTFTNSITTSVTRPRTVNGILLAQLNIGVGRPDYSDILVLPDATQERTSADRSRTLGPPLEWLRWVLLEGSNRIILGYDVVTDNKIGRSGLQYVMRKRRTSWEVPDPFKGYPDNNFITRAIETRANEIERRIFEVVKNNIRR